MTSPEPKLTRLNKFISDTGYCSRREADKLIDQERITINGKVPEMGTKVAEGDEVLVDGKPLKAKQDRIYIAFNKPVGITCTTERHVEGNIVDFINHEQRIFPIGRLDKPSDGLIFLTSDGDIVNKILRAGNAHEKEYVVRVDKPITEEFLQKMAAGVPILDTVTLPCKIKQESRFVFRITLTQGLNRQIRRMCEYLDYEVFKLKRVRIMNIDLGKLASGEWRYLTASEMNEINSMIGESSKTEEASRKIKEVDGKIRVLKKASSGRNHHSNNTFNEKRREKAKEERFGKPSSNRNTDRKPKGKGQSEIKVWRAK
ncbi:23S rRNA pseudouridine(2604) synthase RluF [Aliivibrio finisterrensis]|uniref:Pseudouridine synthase n=1 Tax=Aliivibrio finisterrensis TaxID=511998 RepID=A0A4Q5KHX1_9GAMM|nr:MULTISPECIES: 23S rRNA pseudouridine(2604) synthase RluF [Aliivibrio]MDD9176201.1 23S rRNA pseudouridine(2604) synthase RluF [Aliivibrio sp. S3TY1]MDD9193191.1 23S rRNA pseudouridine(2604) synthase RluF [Aliivibrio sp. S2TY2]RYU45763.1 23S rRNA pseudouridine(2604) synthase RluF [Aliivibrio finisterrensis]